MTDYPEPDELREAALRAAVLDLAAAALSGDASEEELVAAIEAVRQVPIDTERMVNALHVPNDAGEYEDARFTGTDSRRLGTVDPVRGGLVPDSGPARGPVLRYREA